MMVLVLQMSTLIRSPAEHMKYGLGPCVGICGTRHTLRHCLTGTVLFLGGVSGALVHWII